MKIHTCEWFNDISLVQCIAIDSQMIERHVNSVPGRLTLRLSCGLKLSGLREIVDGQAMMDCSEMRLTRSSIAQGNAHFPALNMAPWLSNVDICLCRHRRLHRCHVCCNWWPLAARDDVSAFAWPLLPETVTDWTLCVHLSTLYNSVELFFFSTLYYHLFFIYYPNML